MTWGESLVFMGGDFLHPTFFFSIQKSKQPQGNGVTKSCFDIIEGEISILKIFDLSLRFVFTTDFENHGLVDYKISLFGESQQVFISQLIGKKCLPQCSGIGCIVKAIVFVMEYIKEDDIM